MTRTTASARIVHSGHTRLRTFNSRYGHDACSGSILDEETDTGIRFEEPGGVLELTREILHPERGLLGALSAIYGIPLEPYAANLTLIRQLATSSRFHTSHEYRHAVMQAHSRELLDRPGLLVVYPPATGISAGEPAAAHRLNRVPDKNLMLCHLFGSLGFAQLCDSALLRIPIPLLACPADPAQGLIAPVAPPHKTFSRSLAVRRIARDRFILMEKAPIRRGHPRG